MARFSETYNTDRTRYNQWLQAAQGAADQTMSDQNYLSSKFQGDPSGYAKANMNQVLALANSGQNLTPGYSDLLAKQAPQIYALQNMQSLGNTGQPAGQNFPQAITQWLQPNQQNGQSGYGWGGTTPQSMQQTWQNFTNRYGNSEMMQSMSPDELNMYQSLGLQGTYSPYGYQMANNYLGNQYGLWANSTRATPWLSWLNQMGSLQSPGGTNW
jgi:hypothetical protein